METEHRRWTFFWLMLIGGMLFLSSSHAQRRLQTTHEFDPVPADYPNHGDVVSSAASEIHVTRVEPPLDNSSHSSGGRSHPIQTSHEMDPVPADYPNQGGDDIGGNEETRSNGLTTNLNFFEGESSVMEEMQMESSHQIFIRDRVVRAVCKTLASFAKTGVLPIGRIKQQRDEKVDARCGWWKSVSCEKSQGVCGFQRVSSNSIDDSEDTNSNDQDLAELLKDDLKTLPNINEVDLQPSVDVQPGLGREDDDEESELMLKLPSSAERRRLFNTSSIEKTVQLK